MMNFYESVEVRSSLPPGKFAGLRSIAAAFPAASSSLAMACSRSVFVARGEEFLVRSRLSVTLVQHRTFCVCIFFLTSFFINSIQSISCNK